MSGKECFIPVLYQLLGLGIIVLSWLILLGGGHQRHVFGSLLMIPGVLLLLGGALLLELRRHRKVREKQLAPVPAPGLPPAASDPTETIETKAY